MTTEASSSRVVLDDRLLIQHLFVGLDTDDIDVYTTAYWYHRACRAAVAGAGGHLSGPFEHLHRDEQERSILSLLELPDNIGLPDPRLTVPAMARIALRHPRLNLLNLEAVATGHTLQATVWLSAPAASGLLPAILGAEGISWTTITIP